MYLGKTSAAKFRVTLELGNVFPTLLHLPVSEKQYVETLAP